MFCPQCGQERISEATSFCSRCGYLLTGTADLLRTGGAVPQPPKGETHSPRSRGIKQGLFMFLLMFVVAPIVGLIVTFGIGIEPWPVGVVVFLLGVGGILRMIYALMFESKYPAALNERLDNRELDPSSVNFNTSALPPQRDMPASEYASPRPAAWLQPETREPASVTDNTTKLLEKDGEE
jgi:hypothetical protein